MTIYHTVEGRNIALSGLTLRQNSLTKSRSRSSNFQRDDVFTARSASRESENV
jgi:hypothetical protein